MQNIQIKVSGRVQKTGFPFFVKQFAQLNNINGLVKYLDESSILIEAQGYEADINVFIEYCLIGPNGSVINSIQISHGQIKKYKSFEIIEHTSTIYS